MSRKSGKARIILNEEQRKRFEKIVQSRSAPIREVQRARILLSYSEGESITGIEEIALKEIGDTSHFYEAVSSTPEVQGCSL